MATLATARHLILATLVLSGAACSRFGSHQQQPAVQAPTPTMPGASPRPTPGVSDANVAAILLAANNTDISYARLAPSRAQSQAVKDFAQQMLTDHTAVNQLVTDLLNKIDLTPEDNTTSLDFRDESSAKRDILRELEGRAFDSTYIANEVSYHVKLLGAIDTMLWPTARNAQLKMLISNIRPAVAGHLAHARQVQSALATK